MIAFVKGRLVGAAGNTVVVEAGSIGWRVFVPPGTPLPSVGSEIRLFTHLALRDEGLVLYGFPAEDQVFAFRALLQVDGVGPKLALAILSVLGPEELAEAVVRRDVDLLTRVPGVGPKLAQRLVLELQDRLPAARVGEGTVQDAVAALVSLGYNRKEAREAVQRARATADSLEVAALVRVALKWLGDRRG
ncbi:MAG: Holliday junction branch migration protein RuvA [Desulfotomaculales bacterium]